MVDDVEGETEPVWLPSSDADETWVLSPGTPLSTSGASSDDETEANWYLLPPN